MDLGLKGRKALVCAASKGLGRACAESLAEAGVEVTICSRTKADIEETAKVISNKFQVNVKSVACDITTEEGRTSALQVSGDIDILVNNAGTTKFVDHGDLGGLNAGDFQRIYGVNVLGAFQMTRAVTDSMNSQKEGGAVVNVASTAALTGIGSSIAYAASKGALVTMTLSLARVLGPGVRVNAVCPGFIEGEWLSEGLGQEKYAALMKANRDSAPLGVTATADTVAEAILYFITGPSAVTGETLIVDGGKHLTQTPLVRR